MERMRVALGQASFFIRYYGPKGMDKDMTLKLIHDAIGGPYSKESHG